MKVTTLSRVFISLKTDYSRQLLWFILSGIVGTFILLTDSKFFTATANLGYAFGIFLLLLVFPFHSRVKGTESIIKFGSAFQLQPADLCKLFVNLALAKYLSRVDTNFTRPRSHLIATAIALVPAAMSILQHELGLALVYFSFFPGHVPRAASVIPRYWSLVSHSPCSSSPPCCWNPIPWPSSLRVSPS